MVSFMVSQSSLVINFPMDRLSQVLVGVGI